jgi:hypothetical protein
MVSFQCEEVKTLPGMTLRGSCHTALALRSKFHLTRFALDFDDSLPEGLLQVSSDLYEDLHRFIGRENQCLQEPDV